MPLWRSVRYFLEDIWLEATLWKYSRPARAVQRISSRGKRRLVKTAKKLKAANKRVRRSAKLATIASLPGASNGRLPKSPVPTLLLSNEPPTEPESVLARQAIQTAMEEATHWSEILLQRRSEGKTSRAWEMVTTHKIDQANLFVRQHEGVISAVRRLPMELVQEIFLLFRNTYKSRFSTIHFGQSNTVAPWVLGQVGKSWRTIALNLPTLWRHIPTIYLANSSSRVKLQMQYVGELLRRSGGVLLDISVCVSGFNGTTHPVIDILCEHAERWENVCFGLKRNTFEGLRSVKGRLPALKSLALTDPSVYGDFSESNIINDCFSIAPLLETVQVEGQIRRIFPLPLGQIRHFHENLSYDTLITPIFNSRILETLCLNIFTQNFTFPVTTLPSLIKLHVICHYSLPSSDCFDNVTIPAVRSIKMLTPQANLLPSVTRMISNSSSCVVADIHGRFKVIDQGDLTQLLRLTPELLNLSITMPSSDSDIFALSMNQHLVPLLRSCEFVIEEKGQCDFNLATSLITLASSRCEIGTHDAAVDAAVLPEEIKCLESLRVRFGISEIVSLYEMHSHLEEWIPTSCSQQLISLREQLYDTIPSLHEMSYSRPISFSALDWNHQVNQVLTNINNVSVDDVRSIIFSGITFPLQTIAIQTRIGRNNELAKAILAKWHPTMNDPDSIQGRHWLVHGLCTLVYMTEDSEHRTSSLDPANINCGLGHYRSTTAIYYDY